MVDLWDPGGTVTGLPSIVGYLNQTNTLYHRADSQLPSCIEAAARGLVGRFTWVCGASIELYCVEYHSG